MGKMISYDNKEIEYNGCPGCSYANGEFGLSCGLAFENDKFTISQDWELPIEGFMVVSPKRCVENLYDLTDEERNEMFLLVNETIRILRDNNICERFDVIFEEKENRHLHVWIMPRHKWMKELVGNITGNISEIFNYAKKYNRDEETYNNIIHITNILKNNFDKNLDGKVLNKKF